MSKNKLLKQLKDYRYKINKLYKKEKDFSEEDTKLKFIIKLFGILGWNYAEREMEFEHPVDGNRHVDIALYLGGHKKPKVLVEVKSLSCKKLGRGSQLSGYLRSTNIPLGVYTNGKEIKLIRKVPKDSNPKIPIHFKDPGDFIKYSDVLWLLSKDMIKRGTLEKLINEIKTKTKKYVLWKKRNQIKDSNLRHLEFAKYFLKK